MNKSATSRARKSKLLDIDRVKTLSVGRWPVVYSALGIKVGDGSHTSCPMCGGSDRFRMDDRDGRGTWICNQCGAGDGWTLVQNVLGMNFIQAAHEISGIVSGAKISALPRKENTVSPELLREMFLQSQPASAVNRVGRYLKSRGLSVIPQILRYHPDCYESETKQKHPAMLAVFSLPDGTAVTMHRTFLGIDGKLDIKSPKRIMPTLKKMTGGSVRLFPLGDDGTIAICEGIETAIAVHEDMNITAWAALSATLLEKFIPPAGVKRLFICGDNDRNFAGQKAAYSLANRIALQGKIEVGVYIPLKTGHDWLDSHNGGDT